LNAVCDSSTLIALAKIGHLDILKKVVKNLIIPTSVYEEVVIKGAGKSGSAEIRKAQWIEKRGASDRELVMRLNTILDLGESEAIALAKEIRADLIILDDDKARKVAISEGLRVTGLLILLIWAKEKGVIKEVKPLIDKLRQERFFISEDLYQNVIQKAEE
jgi:predicted nucleic acid-binding protein